MEHTLHDEEIRDLAVSALGLGIGFAILFFGGNRPAQFLLSPEVIPAVIATTVIVAVSFIPHEMAHRVTARSMDAYAEYEMWRPGVVLAVLTSILGFVFAAPGGTRMYTRTAERYGLSVPELDVKMIGYVSVVGPIINISLAVLFAFLAAETELLLYGVNLLVMGANINSFLAVFNLLPVYPIDGYKILRWSSITWLFTAAMAIATFFLI